MSRCLRGIYFPMGGVIGFERPSSTAFPMVGRHRLLLSPLHPFSDGVGRLCHDVSAVFRFRLACGIVSRYDFGIGFSVEVKAS